MRWLCQHDLYTFAKHVLGYADLTEGLHRRLADFVQTTPYALNLYLLARDFFKTSVLTVAHTVQLILRNPEIRILIASNKAENAQAMLREIKGQLQAPKLVSLFPDILWPDPARQADRWTTEAVTVRRRKHPKEATVETIGTEGELTSKHYDWIKMDDLVGRENSQTRDQLLSTIGWWKDAQGLIEPWTRQDLIGTPWAGEDLYAHIQHLREAGALRLGQFVAPCWEPDPAGAAVTVEGEPLRVRPLFPERWPVDRLLELRVTQGADVFAAQRLLSPVDPSTAVFARAKIAPQIRPRATFPPLETLWLALTVDPAISTEAWADYSALAVGGFSHDDILYLLDLRRGKWSETELIEQIYEAWGQTPGIRVGGFEAVGFAKIYRRVFQAEGDRRGRHLPILALERDTRIAKNIRIRGLQPRWDTGRLVIADDVPALQAFLEEAKQFRTYREAAHDDLLDAVVDLEQLRARPTHAGVSAEAWLDDPEADRRRFEDAADPWLRQDRGALRQGWYLHRLVREQEALREAEALGVERDEFWGGPRFG